LGDPPAGGQGPPDLVVHAGLGVEGERADHRRMSGGQRQRVTVQPRRHARPVRVRQCGVVAHAETGEDGEPLGLAGPVYDRPGRVQPVEMGPYLGLDPLGHEVDVQVGDAGQSQRGDVGRHVLVVQGGGCVHAAIVRSPLGTRQAGMAALTVGLPGDRRGNTAGTAGAGAPALPQPARRLRCDIG
jgi:hypothetical protein